MIIILGNTIFMALVIGFNWVRKKNLSSQALYLWIIYKAIFYDFVTSLVASLAFQSDRGATITTSYENKKEDSHHVEAEGHRFLKKKLWCGAFICQWQTRIITITYIK